MVADWGALALKDKVSTLVSATSVIFRAKEPLCLPHTFLQRPPGSYQRLDKGQLLAVNSVAVGRLAAKCENDR